MTAILNWYRMKPCYGRDNASAYPSSTYQKRIEPDVLICRRGKAGAEGGRRRKVRKARISLTEGSEVKKMGHPVTTNPLIIMLINMSIVFAVLIGLSVMIRLIHLVDPTKEK